MKTLVKTAMLALFLAPMAAPFAEAGAMSRACMQSDRKARSIRLCGCIQQVANQALTRGEQRLAASFFKNPHKAQQVRQSDRADYEKFWKKYKQFGATVAASCSAYR